MYSCLVPVFAQSDLWLILADDLMHYLRDFTIYETGALFSTFTWPKRSQITIWQKAQKEKTEQTEQKAVAENIMEATSESMVLIDQFGRFSSMDILNLWN